jgi:hypothetical protein
MVRIPYRRTLPVIQLAVYLLLLWFGCIYRPTWQSRMRQWAAPRTAVAKDDWDLEWADGPTSIAEQAAFGINAPAALAAMLITAPFDSRLHSGVSRELMEHLTTAFCVPVLWFLIGRRFDRRPADPACLSLFRKVLTVAGLTVAALVALLMAVLLIAQFGEFVTGRLFILAWALIGARAALTRIRQWRAETSSLQSGT